MNQKKYVATGIKLVKGLDDYSQQRLFMKTLTKGFCDKKRLQWLEWTCHTLYPETRWMKIDRWMEGMFRSDMKRTPGMIVSMCVNYYHTNLKMYPFLMKMARRVKCRVLMRMRKHPEGYAGQEDDWQG